MQASINFNERSILKVANYTFDGTNFKPRYIIVLYNQDDVLIYATVSKSQVLPAKYEINDRKLKAFDGVFWCFKFCAGDKVGMGKNPFQFPQASSVNVYQRPGVFLTTISKFKESYESETTFSGILDKAIYGELLYIVYHSSFLARKIKKLILPKLEAHFGKID